MIELIDGFACRSTNGCEFITVRIDLLCELDYLADVIKTTVMTTWVSAGI